MTAKTLVQLPSELLYHTLSFLDSHDLVRVRKTCKRLKGIVDNSEVLQYIIDLGYFQMNPMGSSEEDVPPAMRRERLRLYDAARQHVEFKLKRTLPLPTSGLARVDAFGGGIYGSAGESCIHFLRLPPDASDSGDLSHSYDWNHPVDTTNLVNFTFCAAQDLLVVVARSPDLLDYVGRRSHAYEIHLKSLTTNDTHPDAAQPFLKALDKHDINNRILSTIGCVKVQIIGNYVSMLSWAVIANVDDALYSIQMWDWKSKKGYQFNLFSHCGISDYSFITEDKFLVFVASGSMEIYSIDDKSKLPQCTARISLPSLVDGFSYTDVFISKHPTPSFMFPEFRKSHPSGSFHPSADDGLIAILVWVTRTNTDHSFYSRFVVRRSAILELESLYVRTYNQISGSIPRLPWSMWGPQHTSWFRVRLNEDWHTSLCGFRTVESINEFSPHHLAEGPRRLYIRDFNPHIAWNYGAVDKSGWRGKIVPGMMDRTISYPFTEPLGHALTYRETLSKELFDVNEIFSDESRILLVKKSDSSALEKIDVLVF
ncbi:hypothetical protein BDR03DRAFT_987110 [Suillus americanus]|nr:hypothetical protein BDR03DRAFT_987110 [Suillus americanus]